MVAQFLAGVIVGALLGLALAPLLRSWILWQATKDWREPPPRTRDSEPTTTARIDP